MNKKKVVRRSNVKTVTIDDLKKVVGGLEPVDPAGKEGRTGESPKGGSRYEQRGGAEPVEDIDV